MIKQISIGDRFGRLTVIALSKGAKSVHPAAKCICDCGLERTARATCLRRKVVIECAACARKTAGINAGNSLRKFSPDESAFRRLVDQYKANARRRNIEFALNNDQCRSLFLSKCFYCSSAPSLVISSKNGAGKFTYNGIDRKDNNGGYSIDNCASCCSQCNYAKRDMSMDDFIGWVARISKNMGAA